MDQRAQPPTLAPPALVFIPQVWGQVRAGPPQLAPGGPGTASSGPVVGDLDIWADGAQGLPRLGEGECRAPPPGKRLGWGGSALPGHLSLNP